MGPSVRGYEIEYGACVIDEETEVLGKFLSHCRRVTASIRPVRMLILCREGIWSGAVAVLQIRNWMAAASSGRRRKEIGRSWLENGPKRQIIIIGEGRGGRINVRLLDGHV